MSGSFTGPGRRLVASDVESPDKALSAHYGRVVEEMLAGRVVPFLGAGASLTGRPDLSQRGSWAPGDTYLPSGSELAAYLAIRFGYPDADVLDLVRVSQFAAVMNGSGPLYEELRAVFDADYETTPLHRFFAVLPEVLRSKGIDRGHQLIVTTNYDDVLERAFRDAHEPFDLVSYMADGPYRGRFVHWPPDGAPTPIERPNEYRGLSLDKHTAILKIHGATDRENADWDSYVITEDHYIDYLTRTDISNLIPVTLAAKLRRSHFLFLGYGLRDWNLRVILHRIWGAQKLTYKSWAVQLRPHSVEEESWRKRDVDILDVPLERYVQTLSDRINAVETTPAHS